ncbi:hypothetical protein RRV45_05410 [Bacillus sp. DTU_2020_1000418_1_SI_GHA_SEK_038]|uniref:hypothetical protein n=1 Tax=Bacillus sp. DTU_2020_1000418_1_SI_GHA_SEK_038 TaxID=3077585 RepID=UPI0028E97E0D|nr:hypothetical protein [Bacillus sp. DTU_2020_1000418_1_SI_GHA_SEK_038]WNS76448.1 hypothetical protein RRV45_05410 [Bacillus sp. DTU_2020_1000418_1_SI_GHA_SEK_038]
MKNFSELIHIGELIAVSKVFQLNTFQMITLLENGLMEVFDNKEAFLEKYGKEEAYGELDWCELNNGKIFTIQK